MTKKPRGEAEEKVQADVGKRIMSAREECALTLAELASRIGVHYSTLSKIESGGRAASMFNIMNIARRLSVSTDFLLLGLLNAKMDEDLALRLAAKHPEAVVSHNWKSMRSEPVRATASNRPARRPKSGS